jgi:hypothetical protein
VLGQGGSCIAAGQQVLGACENERNTLNGIYQLSSTQPATDRQVSDSLAALQAANLPAQR